MGKCIFAIATSYLAHVIHGMTCNLAHIIHGMTCAQYVHPVLDITSKLKTPHRSDWQACRDIIPDPPGMIQNLPVGLGPTVGLALTITALISYNTRVS